MEMEMGMGMKRIVNDKTTTKDPRGILLFIIYLAEKKKRGIFLKKFDGICRGAYVRGRGVGSRSVS
jgi:hypothetical protein